MSRHSRSRVSAAAEDKPPDNPTAALMRVLWRLPLLLRFSLIVLIVALSGVIKVWTILPEATKAQLSSRREEPSVTTAPALRPPTEPSRVTRKHKFSQSGEVAFLVALREARTHRKMGNDGPAARVFGEAARGIPQKLKQSVNYRQLEEAKKALGRASFGEASDRFEVAFKGIQSP